MKFLFKLSGEHEILPLAELLAVLQAEGLNYKILKFDRAGRLAMVEINCRKTDFAGRLALTQKAVEVVLVGRKLEKIAEGVYPKIRNAKSFRVKCDSNTVERTLGALLHARGLKVDLTKPERTVCVFKLAGKFIAGFEIPIEKNFEERHPLKRPFFHPTSMKPKTARMLVNLACMQKGETLLDPFCGAGGILIEAGLLGLKTYGWDIDRVMLEGCRKNVRHYARFPVFSSPFSRISGFPKTGDRKPRTEVILEQHDALSRHAIKVDAVVTDPPYGKSSTTLGVKPEKLYNKFLENIKHNLKKNGRLVIVLPEQYKLKHKGFKLENKFKIRVHKSLTRAIWILKKS